MLAALKAVYRALASYGVGITALCFLLVLTFLGTLDQVTHGLYVTQQKYFSSLFLIQDVFGAPLLPLPGVYLLLVVLFINLVLGGVMRFRWRWTQTGVLIAHAGILFLLLGGFVTFRYSSDGHLTLYENEQSNEVLSYYDWEIAIIPADAGAPATAYYIPSSEFRGAGPGNSAMFHNAALPFDLTVSGYLPNAKVVDGKVLAAVDPDPDQERNMAGAYVSLKETATGTVHDGTIWGFRQTPFEVTIAGKPWTLALQRRRWQLPFTVALDKFTRELYPGTQMPSSFSSDVSVIEPLGMQKFHIAMNKPLRYKGYTLFQSSWGPADAGPNDRLFSTLAVVRNPADDWPLYACVIITIGLLVHFGYKLVRHLRAEARNVL
jgi:hypothetical protein